MVSKKREGISYSLYPEQVLIIVAPLTVPFIAINYGWQMTFVITGAIGFIWIVFWMMMYRLPQDHPKLGKAELEYITSDPMEPQIKIPCCTC